MAQIGSVVRVYHHVATDADSAGDVRADGARGLIWGVVRIRVLMILVDRRLNG